MTKINDAINDIRKTNKIGLMGHVIAGYPDIKSSFQAALGICEGGADFLEVQFPFSDPTADGPTIEGACYDALKNGFTVDKGFELTKKLASETSSIILIMTYGNIIYKYGMEKFIIKAKECGAAGIIAPDIPLENDEGLRNICKKNDFANILIAAPGANADRIKTLSQKGMGFLYTVARRGITGKRSEINKETKDWLKLVKENSLLPIAVGFGIQSSEQIKAIKGFCDIAVVGSYFVGKITENLNKKKDLKKELFKATKDLISS